VGIPTSDFRFPPTAFHLQRLMRLSDDELRDVLARAEEIQRNSRTADTMQAEFEAVIGAGEAVGLTRPALERALRERLELADTPPPPGSRVFAQSADGKFYVAEVISAADDSVRVRYLRGSEHTVTAAQLRPCSLLPGEKVMANWPWWGPWKCAVVSYDAAKQKVKLTDGWGYTRSFAIAEIWQSGRKAGSGKARLYATWLGTGAGVGAILGSAVTWLLLR
jgi:hypothetical protein